MRVALFFRDGEVLWVKWETISKVLRTVLFPESVRSSSHRGRRGLNLKVDERKVLGQIHIRPPARCSLRAAGRSLGDSARQDPFLS